MVEALDLIKEILFEIEGLVGPGENKKAEIRMGEYNNTVRIEFATIYRKRPYSILTGYNPDTRGTRILMKPYAVLRLIRDLIIAKKSKNHRGVDVADWCDEMSYKIDEIYHTTWTSRADVRKMISIIDKNEDIIEKDGFRVRLKINASEIGVRISPDLKSDKEVYSSPYFPEEVAYRDIQKTP